MSALFDTKAYPPAIGFGHGTTKTTNFQHRYIGRLERFQTTYLVGGGHMGVAASVMLTVSGCHSHERTTGSQAIDVCCVIQALSFIMHYNT